MLSLFFTLIAGTISYPSDALSFRNIDPKTMIYFNALQWNFNTSINRKHLGFVGEIYDAAGDFASEQVTLFDQGAKDELLRITRDVKAVVKRIS